MTAPRDDYRADLISYHARSIAKYVLEQMAGEFYDAIATNSTEESRAAAADTYRILDKAASIVSGNLCAEADREAREEQRRAAE